MLYLTCSRYLSETARTAVQGEDHHWVVELYEDPVKAAAEISGGEQNLICTTLAQMTVQAGLASGASLKRVPSLIQG